MADLALLESHAVADPLVLGRKVGLRRGRIEADIEQLQTLNQSHALPANQPLGKARLANRFSRRRRVGMAE